MHKYKFLVLYGSETGTAQDVAERVWREGKMLGLSGGVLAMDDYQINELPTEEIVIFICSTTGQGEPPTNMRNFWRFLLRKNLPPNSLHNVKFAVLGLGDSSYAKFNHAGKKLFRRLEMLGGQSLISPGWADDQHDLGPDAVVDPWIQQLLERFTYIHPQLYSPDNPPPLLSKWSVNVDMGQKADKLSWPLSQSAQAVRVASNTRTTPEQHFQDVRVLRLECLDGDSFKYTSGDVAVVRPSNSKSSVAELLEALPQLNASDVLTVGQRDPDMPVPSHLESPVSLLELATYYWDLNACPRRSVLEVLSRLAGSDSEEDQMEKEKLEELCSSTGQEEYFSYCTRPRRTILELLRDFPHTARSIPVQFLFDIFQPIRPRMFSIASPPQDKYVEILVAVVRYKTRMFKPRLGLCSNWLASLVPRDTVQLDVRPGSLRFPKSGNLLLVGPGTGVAPFRSYICGQQFQNLINSSSDAIAFEQSAGDQRARRCGTTGVTLVFGCRNGAADFHFKDDFIDRKGLTLFTAFSRDQPHKIYVQNVISENSEYFSRLLCDRVSHIMVAGNAKEMPEAVRKAFITVVAKENSLSESDAEKIIEGMENKGLYQTETWS